MAQEIYGHYKSQNKLPVFFMTLGGVVALLFGFGYLMQFAEDIYFEFAKIGSGLAAAAVATWWGRRLLVEYERYSEFGSALLGLGLSLVYLSLYTMSESAYMPWAGGAVGVLLLLANTAWGAWLALRYDTKVVAFISLLGGACVPFSSKANLSA